MHFQTVLRLVARSNTQPKTCFPTKRNKKAGIAGFTGRQPKTGGAFLLLLGRWDRSGPAGICCQHYSVVRV